MLKGAFVFRCRECARADAGPGPGTARDNMPLRHFLQASMLSTDTETPEDEKSKDVSGKPQSLT